MRGVLCKETHDSVIRLAPPLVIEEAELRWMAAQILAVFKWRSMLDRGTMLVTGGAGFIGSALIWALNQAGHERILVADIPTVRRSGATWCRCGSTITSKPSGCASGSTGGVLDHVRTVVHLGACSSTTETDGAYLMRNNFEYHESAVRVGSQAATSASSTPRPPRRMVRSKARSRTTSTSRPSVL